jgi:hypothetical protein
MADAKISALTAASTPLAGTEVLPIVQSGTTKKVAVSSLTAGRAVSTGVLTVVNGTNPYIEMPDGTGTTYIQVASGDLNFVPRSGKNVSISNSNLVIGTAAKGIDFSANGGDILTQYDEGTWTPNQGNGLTVVGAFSSNGRYTRVGRLVTVSGTVIGATSIAVSAIGQICDNLPFVKAGASVSTGTAASSALTSSGVALAGGAILYSLTALSGGTEILFALTYEVA